MNLEEDILIERYLSNDLSEIERKKFLTRIDSDAAFARKVTLEQQLFESFNDDSWSTINDTKTNLIDEYKEIYKSEEIRNLDKELRIVNKRYQSSKKRNIIRLMLYSSVASVALFLVFNVFFTSYTTQELYNESIELSNMPSFISRENANENELVKAQLLFEEKSYEKAVIIFERELDSPDNLQNASIFLFTGVTQMELNDFKNAEITFDKLISSDLLDAEKGLWYKALLYLKMGRIEVSKTLLEEIVATESYNSEKARALLKKFSKITNP